MMKSSGHRADPASQAAPGRNTQLSHKRGITPRWPLHPERNIKREDGIPNHPSTKDKSKHLKVSILLKTLTMHPQMSAAVPGEQPVEDGGQLFLFLSVQMLVLQSKKETEKMERAALIISKGSSVLEVTLVSWSLLLKPEVHPNKVRLRCAAIMH